MVRVNVASRCGARNEDKLSARTDTKEPVMQCKPAVLFLLATLTAAPAFARPSAADFPVPDTGFGSVGTATAVGTSVPPPELMREIVTRGYDQLNLKPD